jgi:hypothetical protein
MVAVLQRKEEFNIIGKFEKQEFDFLILKSPGFQI